MKNRFKVTDYLQRNVGELRRSIAEDSSWIPAEADDSDFIVRVIGRCVDGTCIGRKAQSFSLFTAELMTYDPANCRRMAEDSAHVSWEMLPCQ